MADSRDMFHTAVMASKVSCAFGAAITGTIFILEVYSIWENRSEGYDFTKAQKRWRFHLAGATLCAFILLNLDGSLTWLDWTGNEKGCADIQIPHVLAYCVAKQFLYLFLYDRAKIVHDSLRLDDRKMFYLRMIRWLLWLTVVFGVSVFFYWSAFLAFSGRVSQEGTCMFYAIYPQVIVAFSVSDFFLASGMFGIFAFPLWEHVKSMATVKSDERIASQLQRVIRKNLFWSSVALTSAFVCLNAEAVVMWIARDDDSAQSDYLREFGLFNISIDNWFGIVVAHMMTSAWLPSFIRKPSRAVESDTGMGSVPKSPTASNHKEPRSAEGKKPEKENSSVQTGTITVRVGDSDAV